MGRENPWIPTKELCSVVCVCQAGMYVCMKNKGNQSIHQTEKKDQLQTSQLEGKAGSFVFFLPPFRALILLLLLLLLVLLFLSSSSTFGFYRGLCVPHTMYMYICILEGSNRTIWCHNLLLFVFFNVLFDHLLLLTPHQSRRKARLSMDQNVLLLR